MTNYIKVLEFFMENKVQLNKDQLCVLKEEFLNESKVGELLEKIRTSRNNGLDPNDQFRDEKGHVKFPKIKKKKQKDSIEGAEEENNKDNLDDYNIEEKD